MSNKHEFSNSSFISHVDYHENGTMEIKFSSGAVYHYPNCDRVHYDALKSAASAGKYFHTQIRRLKSVKVF